MSDAERDFSQRVARPALKPFVKPLPDAPRPVLRAAPVIGGRPTVPPFGPIRYGGPRPGAAGSPGATAVAEDDETPTWSSLASEPVVYAPAPVAEPEPEPPAPVESLAPAAITPPHGVPDVPTLHTSAPSAEPEAERPSEAYAVSAAPEAEPEPEATETYAAVNESILDFGAAVEPGPEPEQPTATTTVELTADDLASTPDYSTGAEDFAAPRFPRMIGPTDPTPVLNRRVTPPWQRTVDPRRMTPMRVTPLRPTTAVAPLAAMPVDDHGGNRTVATALETVAARIRRGELVVTAAVPTGDDPPTLAAALAVTLAALLGARG